MVVVTAAENALLCVLCALVTALGVDLAVVRLWLVEPSYFSFHVLAAYFPTGWSKLFHSNVSFPWSVCTLVLPSANTTIYCLSWAGGSDREWHFCFIIFVMVVVSQWPEGRKNI